MKNKIIFLTGPTASGKTGLSLNIAKKFPNQKFEIINFDSLLFYKELNIGSAKPSSEEMKTVTHHLVNISSVKNEINANQFVKLALEKIKVLHEQNVIPILVGGSTFYLRSLVKGMYSSPTVSDEIRNEVTRLYESKNIDPFIEYLQTHDPKSLETLHQNDHYRIMRAYEHHKMTGTPISEQKEKLDEEQPYNFSKNIHPHWDILHISLEIEKEKHWKIIKERTEEMIRQGLVQEVKDLLDQGLTGNEKPLQSIGYKETISHLRGEILDAKDLIEKIYIATRRLAKSQKTFLKKITPRVVYDPTEQQDQVFLNLTVFLSE